MKRHHVQSLKNIFGILGLATFLSVNNGWAQPGCGDIHLHLFADSLSIVPFDTIISETYDSISEFQFKTAGKDFENSWFSHSSGSNFYVLKNTVTNAHSGHESIVIQHSAHMDKKMVINIKNARCEYSYMIDPVIFTPGEFTIDLPDDRDQFKKKHNPTSLHISYQCWDITPPSWKITVVDTLTIVNEKIKLELELRSNDQPNLPTNISWNERLSNEKGETKNIDQLQKLIPVKIYFLTEKGIQSVEWKEQNWKSKKNLSAAPKEVVVLLKEKDTGRQFFLRKKGPFEIKAQ